MDQKCCIGGKEMEHARSVVKFFALLFLNDSCHNACNNTSMKNHFYKNEEGYRDGRL